MHFPTLQTCRLTIRQFTAADAPAVYAYTSNPQVMTYIPEGPLSAEQARAFVEQHSGADARAVAVVRSADHQLVGHLSFHPWFAPQTYEIGWVFHPEFHGQGYASESAQALLDYGFESLELHRIVATCQPENPASARVMAKIGMRCEGHFRQCIYRENGVWWDELFYAILREEWLGQRAQE